MSKIMRKTIVIAIIVVLVLAFSLIGFVACNNKDQTVPSGNDDSVVPQNVDPITITDMIGRQVTVKPGTYKRVVCIGAGALRMYSYIGDVNLLAGVEDIDNTTREQRPKMFDASARPYQLAFKDVFNAIENSCGVGGPNAQQAEAEKILACRPDIVISEYEDVEKENALQQSLGGDIPVITVKYGPRGVFDNNVLNSFTMLGKIFNRKSRAAVLNAYIKEQTREISERTATVDEAERPSVYICGLGNWGTTNQYMTAQNYAPFEIAHIKNAVTGIPTSGPPQVEITAEKLMEIGQSVDIMIVDSAAVKNIKPLTTESTTVLANVKAWQEGKVYLEMPYNAYYTNLETALINTWYLAKVAYPDLFEDIDMTDKTNEITYAFLGKDLAAEIFACATSFSGYQQISNPSQFFA